MVLERTGNDFRGRGRTGINEHDHGCMAVLRLVCGVIVVAGRAVTAAYAHNASLLQEHVRHAYCLIEKPAGVVAQIKHYALDSACSSTVLFSLLKSLGQFIRGPFGETGNADPVVAVFQLPALDADDRNGIAFQADGNRLHGIGMHDGELYLGSLGPAYAGNNILKGHFHCALAVNGQDNVACLHACLESRSVLNGGHDQDFSVVLGDFDTDAEEFADCLLLHFLVFFCCKEGRMRIQGLQHALNGAVNKFPLAYFLHIGSLDYIKDLSEAAQGIKFSRLGLAFFRSALLGSI